MFLSWLVANWSNILFLFLSNRTIEERISTLTRINFFDYLNHVFFPLFIGVCLAVVYPYAQIWLENKHRRAFMVRSLEEKEKAKEALKTIIEMADLKAQAEGATEYANKKRQNESDLQQRKQIAELELIEAKKLADQEVINQEKETKIISERNKQMLFEDNISELTKNLSQIKGQITILESRIALKKKDLEKINIEFDLVVSSFKDILANVKSYNNVSDSQSLFDITRNIVAIINERNHGFGSVTDLGADGMNELINANNNMLILNNTHKS
jgi:hypothetical protein